MLEQTPSIPPLAQAACPGTPVGTGGPEESAHEVDLSSASFSAGPAGTDAPSLDARPEKNTQAQETAAPRSLSPADLLEIRSALRMSFRLFDDLRRSWGPSETLPLASHTSEVGLLLLAAGEKKEVVMAGFLHDIFEGYIKADLEEIKKRVLTKYGSEVVRLVEAVTEPPKSSLPGNWLERKLAVLENLEAGDRDTATLSCATKISTIAAGSKFLRMGRPLSEWSAGGPEDNMVMFERYLDVYKAKGVNPVLLDQMEMELSFFASKLGLR